MKWIYSPVTVGKQCFTSSWQSLVQAYSYFGRVVHRKYHRIISLIISIFNLVQNNTIFTKNQLLKILHIIKNIKKSLLILVQIWESLMILERLCFLSVAQNLPKAVGREVHIIYTAILIKVLKCYLELTELFKLLHIFQSYKWFQF